MCIITVRKRIINILSEDDMVICRTPDNGMRCDPVSGPFKEAGACISIINNEVTGVTTAASAAATSTASAGADLEVAGK